MSASDPFVVGPRRLRDDSEFELFQRLRAESFTPWNFPAIGPRSPQFGRHALNALAAVFPEFLLEGRTADGRLAAFLSTLPAWWGGAAEALIDLDHHQGLLRPGNRRMRLLGALQSARTAMPRLASLSDRLSRKWREDRLAGCNTIMLAAIIIDPAVRGQQIPSRMFAAVQRNARQLGFEHVISPFRPSAYGEFKSARAAAHSAALFEEYCSLRNAEGLPVDPWLRALARNGVEFLRTEPRSMRQSGSLDDFDRFRATFRAHHWYSPATDVWECGLTPTWYVDRARRTVTSTEPNYWGRLTWPEARQPAGASAPARVSEPAL